MLFGPVDPALEVPRLDGIAVDERAGVFEVAGVEIEAMVSRDHAQGCFDVAAQFGDGARLAWVIAGGLDAAAGEQRARPLETADVVALPAVQRDGICRDLVERGIRVHA